MQHRGEDLIAFGERAGHLLDLKLAHHFLVFLGRDANARIAVQADNHLIFRHG
jgi:hypothetical protein